jgi:hypothetical protein
LIQRQSVIQTGSKYGRWLAAVFSRTHNDNDIGGAGLIHGGLGVDLHCHPPKPPQKAKSGRHGHPA